MYYQRNIPSPNEMHSFTLDNFVGGLNNRNQNPALNQSIDVMNMRFTEDGFIEKRKGIEYVDGTDLTAPITFMDYYRPYDSPPVLLRATESDLFIGSSSSRSVNGQVFGVNHLGNYLYVDTSGIYCYGTFNLTAGTYIHLIGTAPAEPVRLKVVNPPADFTPLPIEHKTGVTVYNFNTMEVYYEPCLNEIEDTSKGANVIPNNPSYILNREGRIYVAGSKDNDDTVYISDINKPFYFPVLLSLQLPPNSDKIKGLCLYNNTVVVGRENDMFVIKGNNAQIEFNADLFTLQQLSAHTGLANQRTFLSAHNYCFYLGSDGQFYVIRSLDTNTDALATTVISKDVDLTLHPINATREDFFNAAGCFYKNAYYVTVGDKVLVYNYLYQAWSVYNQLDVSCFLRVGEDMIMGTKHGRTITESESFLDLGKPYKCYWKSPYLDMGAPASFKFFREFLVTGRTFEDYRSDIRFRFEIDYSEFDTGIKVSNQMSIWGKSRFGDRFINKNINTTVPMQIGQRGRVLQIYYENGYDVIEEFQRVEDLPSFIELEEQDNCYYVIDEDAYYVFSGTSWTKLNDDDLDQPARVQHISGYYEMRGRRY